ncbi:MAG: radical SAM family heme chaperone HemW [Marinilabiliaceae bacterium]|nr:radical SAM family heme chaperone HemW [Marinilabiliaceae bacterium]
MAGIYIHVPFCYSRCSYCDFYKTTDQSLKHEYIKAICKEIELNSQFFLNNVVNTLYFGGGTPSTLSCNELAIIFEKLKKSSDNFSPAEITMEVNPDDVTDAYVEELVVLGVNRISMGIQSFSDDHLRKMNRRHNSSQAIDAIRILKSHGIKNISIDLIYGLPYMSFDQWKSNVQKALDLDVAHVSAYHLTFEKGTPYYDYLKKGIFKEIEEDDSVRQFDYLVKEMEQNGFINYEISNFCKPFSQSHHNSNYWTGEKYLGLGPSAHSFDGNKRLWNFCDLQKYCAFVQNGGVYFEEEELTRIDRYNELVMLGLRTKEGIDVNRLKAILNTELNVYFQDEIRNQIEHGNIQIVDNYYRVTDDKRFITDRIISELFYITD